MRYVAQRNCRINGKNFVKGDVIPPGDLSAYEGMKLERYGFISEIPNSEIMSDETTPEKASTIPIPILSADGQTLDLSADEVIKVFSVLQMSAADAASAVKSEESDNVCNLLGFIEQRRTVVTALSKRSADMDAAEEEEEQKQEESKQTEITDGESDVKESENGGDE